MVPRPTESESLSMGPSVCVLISSPGDSDNRGSLRSSDREVSLRGCGSAVDSQLILDIGGFLMGGLILLGPKAGGRPHCVRKFAFHTL